MENDNLAKRTQFFLMNSMTVKTVDTWFIERLAGERVAAVERWSAVAHQQARFRDVASRNDCR